MQESFLIVISSVVVMMVHEKLCPVWIMQNNVSRLGKARRERKVQSQCKTEAKAKGNYIQRQNKRVQGKEIYSITCVN